MAGLATVAVIHSSQESFTTESQRKPYRTLLMIPCVSSELLKLISRPTFLPESFMYVRSWGLMDWKHPLYRLQLDDHFMADNQIDFVSAVKLYPFV
jgi:hypothetical protein